MYFRSQQWKAMELPLFKCKCVSCKHVCMHVGVCVSVVWSVFLKVSLYAYGLLHVAVCSLVYVSTCLNIFWVCVGACICVWVCVCVFVVGRGVHSCACVCFCAFMCTCNFVFVGMNVLVCI